MSKKSHFYVTGVCPECSLLYSDCRCWHKEVRKRHNLEALPKKRKSMKGSHAEKKPE